MARNCWDSIVISKDTVVAMLHWKLDGLKSGFENQVKKSLHGLWKNCANL